MRSSSAVAGLVSAVVKSRGLSNIFFWSSSVGSVVSFTSVVSVVSVVSFFSSVFSFFPESPVPSRMVAPGIISPKVSFSFPVSSEESAVCTLSDAASSPLSEFVLSMLSAAVSEPVSAFDSSAAVYELVSAFDSSAASS